MGIICAKHEERAKHEKQEGIIKNENGELVVNPEWVKQITKIYKDLKISEPEKVEPEKVEPVKIIEQ